MISWPRTLTALLSAVVAALVWIGLTLGEHLWQDHADHHVVLELLKYNIQQGRLVPLALQPVPPQPPPQGK